MTPRSSRGGTSPMTRRTGGIGKGVRKSFRTSASPPQSALATPLSGGDYRIHTQAEQRTGLNAIPRMRVYGHHQKGLSRFSRCRKARLSSQPSSLPRADQARRASNQRGCELSGPAPWQQRMSAVPRLYSTRAAPLSSLKSSYPGRPHRAWFGAKRCLLSQHRGGAFLDTSETAVLDCSF